MGLSDEARAATKAQVAEKRKKQENADRLRHLESIIEDQAKTIEQLRGSRFKFRPVKVKKSKAKSFCRVIIPDSHGSVIDTAAASAFLADLEIIRPTEIVMLGDHLECGGFLAEHHTLGYVAQSEYSFVDDCNAANQFLDEIQSRCPGATIDYLEGNHERRIETWIITHTLRHQSDAEYLRGMFSTETVLHLAKRGINWCRQGVFYDGLPIPATIKRGHCHFTHGTSTAKHAAAVTLSRFGGPVVYGHTHRADSYVAKTVRAGTIGAWNPGCLCKLQPLWQHSNPTDWTHGYGVQMVTDRDFLHINVPIIDGVSYLRPLAERLSHG
jgi:hypothetical protein